MFLAAVAQHAEAKASSAAPSEAQASDFGDPEDNDLFEDDDKWQKVPKAKRRALVTKERDALAGKVRQLVSKVSISSSPFNKKKGKDDE